MKNSYDEQKLRDEVIYLHYLWQQGPPTPPPSPHPPQSNPILPHWRHHHDPFPPPHTRSLPPVNSTTFKKKKVTKPEPISSENRRVNTDDNNVTKPDSPGWPVPVPVSRNSPQTGWPTPNPKPNPPPQPQEIERLSALHLQNKACKAFKDSLLIDSDDDDDDENEEDYEDEDEDDNEDGDDRFKQFENFFIKVFMEDNELRWYYQRCFENGEFLCLVCAADKKNNKNKKYKDCMGLVQHSKLILRTANKVAHRAFGEVVCKVLGWDVRRLPTIVLKGEPLGPAQSLGEPKESVAAAADDGKDGLCNTEDIAVSLDHVEDPTEEHAKGVDKSIAECSSKEGDIDESGGGEAQYEGETKEKVVFEA